MSLLLLLLLLLPLLVVVVVVRVRRPVLLPPLLLLLLLLPLPLRLTTIIRHDARRKELLCAALNSSTSMVRTFIAKALFYGTGRKWFTDWLIGDCEGGDFSLNFSLSVQF